MSPHTPLAAVCQRPDETDRKSQTDKTINGWPYQAIDKNQQTSLAVMRYTTQGSQHD
jgi:hypothetical protein